MAKKPTTPKEPEVLKSIAPVTKLKAYSVEKFGVGDWRVVTFEIQGDKILSKTSSDGGDKALSLERFKLVVAKDFYFGK